MEKIAEKAKKGRSLLEKIFELVPGYGGYHDKERRRSADKILREFLAKRLERTKKVILKLCGGLTDKGEIGLLKLLGRQMKKIEKIADKLRFANYGYTGLFALTKIDAKILDKLYEFDYSLISQIHNIEQELDQISKTKEIDKQGEVFTNTIEKLESALDEREKIIRKFEEEV